MSDGHQLILSRHSGQIPKPLRYNTLNQLSLQIYCIFIYLFIYFAIQQQKDAPSHMLAVGATIISILLTHTKISYQHNLLLM